MHAQPRSQTEPPLSRSLSTPHAREKNTHTNKQLVLSLISAVSSVFIIVTFWRFPRLQTFAYKIIMMLAVANLFLDAAYLMGAVGHNK